MKQKERWQKNLKQKSEQTGKIIKKSRSWLARFTYENQAVITATLGTLAALAYFILTAYPENIFDIFGFIRIRFFGLGIIIFISLLTAYSAIYLSNKWFNKILVWLEANILIFFSFSYFLSIENSNYYPFAIAFLSALIYIIFYDLFGEQKHYLLTRLTQVLLYTLQTFSLITFINVDRSASRNIDIDFLSQILQLNEIFWILLCCLSVALISITSFKLKDLKSNLLFYFIFFIFLFQALIIINTLSFNQILYWHKTIIFITVWDFLFLPLQTISKQIYDDKYKAKIIVSSVYHGLVLLLIFFLSFLVV